MIFVNRPLITCTVVTTGRVELVKRAVACYLSQTYHNRNMVILSQGDPESNEAIKQHVADHKDILFLSAPTNLSLGAMRNAAVELATGEVICQWDDDDLYHPDRLMTQYKALLCHKQNVASVYTEFLKYFRTTGEMYWCDWIGEPMPASKFLSGSIMFYKREFHRFPLFYPQSGSQSNVEEDLNVLQKLLSIGAVEPVRCGYQYIYVYHGSNTYDLDHHRLTLSLHSGKNLMQTNDLCDRKSLLEATFKIVGVNELVSVRSQHGEAFSYTPGATHEI